MQQFPNWVPDEVTNYYWDLHDHGDSREIKTRQTDFDVLRRCIESPYMEKPWRAIARRDQTCDPMKFAQCIVTTVWLSRTTDRWPSTSEVASYKRLSMKVRALIADCDAVFDQSTYGRREEWFGDLPNDYLEDLANRFDYCVKVFDIMRIHFKTIAGKPRSKNNKRTYVIRILSTFIRQMYGQPLHDVVAATSSIILNEHVDSELARKLAGKIVCDVPLSLPSR